MSASSALLTRNRWAFQLARFGVRSKAGERYEVFSAEPDHRKECGRAASVSNDSAIGQRCSVLSFFVFIRVALWFNLLRSSNATRMHGISELWSSRMSSRSAAFRSLHRVKVGIAKEILCAWHSAIKAA